MESLISIADAAKLVGRGPSTIRKLAQDGHIRAKKNAAGHYVVERTSLLAYLAVSDPAPGAGERRAGASRALNPATAPATAAPSSAEIALLRARFDSAEESLRIERQRGAEERRRCDDLLTINAALQAQLIALAAEFRAFMSGEPSSKPSRFSSIFKGKS